MHRLAAVLSLLVVACGGSDVQCDCTCTCSDDSEALVAATCQSEDGCCEDACDDACVEQGAESASNVDATCGELTGTPPPTE